jgi:NADH:ubiquinone oxidoreductase subunit 3 (subunit A)
MGSIKNIETLDFSQSNSINNYLKNDVESQYIIDNTKKDSLFTNKKNFLDLTGDYSNVLLYISSQDCILTDLNDIKFYDKDNSFTDKAKLIYDITYSNFYPIMNKLLFILDVEREILLELHNYQIKYKSIGKNIFGHQFKIRCKYTWNEQNDVKVVESDLGYYEIELVFKNDQTDKFVQIYNKYIDSEITQDPTDMYINSIEKVLEIINSNTISLLSPNTESGAGKLQAQKVSLNTIINSINKGESILALYQYKRVDYLKLMLNDIIKRNLYYRIKLETTKETTSGQTSDLCVWTGNSKLKKNFDYFYNNFKNYEQNHNEEFEIFKKNVIEIVNNKKKTGKVWKKNNNIKDGSDLDYENITGIDTYQNLFKYIKNNYDNYKYLNTNNTPDSISLSLDQIESLSKNDFYNGNKTAYIVLETNTYEISYDDILLMNNDDDEIYKTEKIFEKTTKLRNINDELEKKNKLLKRINSNVEFEKKKLDKINVVYIFTICLFILLSIILILLGSDKIDYNRGRNFINTLIFLTFIIFFGLHYYIGKIKETQKDTIKLNNILDDEIFKIKSTVEKFEVSDANAINSKLSMNTNQLIFYIVDIISKLNGFSINGDSLNSDQPIISYLKNNSYLLTDSTKSYYNVVDPLLNKELEDYDKRNENTKMYKNIADFNLNISRRDTKFSIETINYLLNLSLLLAIILLVIFYNSDFTKIIGVIGIIIFIIISILYFTRILRIVRTDNKKKYWQKPLESDLKKL